MARIDIRSNGGGGGSVATGVLQLQGGVAMSSTLRAVTDQNNTTSPLKLSTTAVQVVSPLRITTDDPSDMYLDCEDGATNNRFNITRNTASQQVNLNFASNPGGSTTVVGGIRTYVDGVNLTEVMKFREDGQLQIGSTSASAMYWDNVNNRLGVGTNSPSSKIAIVDDALVQSIFGIKTSQSASTFQIFNSNSTTTPVWNVGVSDLDTRFIMFDTLYFRVNGTQIAELTASEFRVGGASGARVAIKGGGSTSATTSLLVQNSAGTNTFKVQDDGAVLLGVTSTPRNDWALNVGGSLSLRALNSSADALGVYDNTTLTTYINGGGDIRTSGKIGVGSSALMTFQASAKLQIDSTTQGFLPPRMTDAQRAAISSPAEGLLVYNTDNHAVAYRDGTNWGYLCGALQNQTGSGGTLAISFASGNIVNLTLNASTTLTFAGHVVGTYIIQVTQGGAGSNTLTYPASVKWSGGTAPTLTTAVGQTDILTFYHDGTNFFGTYSLNY